MNVLLLIFLVQINGFVLIKSQPTICEDRDVMDNTCKTNNANLVEDLVYRMTQLEKEQHDLKTRMIEDNNHLNEENDLLKDRVRKLEELLSWQLVFRASSGTSSEIYELFAQREGINEYEDNWRSLNSSVVGNWKKSDSNVDWANVKVLKLTIYKDSKAAFWVIFDATGKDKMTWLDRNGMIESSSKDLLQQTSWSYAFSIAGYVSNTFIRRFHIWSQNSGCDRDIGWMLVLEIEDVCGWGKNKKYPAFLYTTTGQRQNANDMGEGDLMTVHVKYDLP